MAGRGPLASPGSLGRGAERTREVPQSGGPAGERLGGPGVAFPQLSGGRARSGSGSGGSAGPAGRVWRRHLPGLPRARAAARAPRLRWPRGGRKGSLGLGAACLSALPPLSVGGRLWSGGGRRPSSTLTAPGEFVNFIRKTGEDGNGRTSKFQIVVSSDASPSCRLVPSSASCFISHSSRLCVSSEHLPRTEPHVIHSAC